MSYYYELPSGVRPSEACLPCHACGEPLVRPKRASKAPPFCTKPACRRAAQRWRYYNEPGFKERTIAGVMRRRAAR